MFRINGCYYYSIFTDICARGGKVAHSGNFNRLDFLFVCFLNRLLVFGILYALWISRSFFSFCSHATDFPDNLFCIEFLRLARSTKYTQAHCMYWRAGSNCIDVNLIWSHCDNVKIYIHAHSKWNDAAIGNTKLQLNDCAGLCECFGWNEIGINMQRKHIVWVKQQIWTTLLAARQSLNIVYTVHCVLFHAIDSKCAPIWLRLCAQMIPLKNEGNCTDDDVDDEKNGHRQKSTKWNPLNVRWIHKIDAEARTIFLLLLA